MKIVNYLVRTPDTFLYFIIFSLSCGTSVFTSLQLFEKGLLNFSATNFGFYINKYFILIIIFNTFCPDVKQKIRTRTNMQILIKIVERQNDRQADTHDFTRSSRFARLQEMNFDRKVLFLMGMRVRMRGVAREHRFLILIKILLTA